MADGIALRFGFTPYSAEDERLLSQVLAMPAGPVSARAGVRPGTGLTVTVGGTPEVATVAAGSCIITDPDGGGSYLVVVPEPVVLAMPTRPASGSSRIHEVVARVLNVDHRSTDGVREVDLYIAEGTASSSPSAPSVPTGRLRLRRLTVPSSGSVSVSSVAPRTVAVGGVLPVATQAERDAISPVWDGLVVYREDTDVLEVRRGGAWTRLLTTADLPTDTGWVDIPLASGFIAPSGSEPQIRIRGPQAFFRGAVAKTGTGSAATFTAGTNHTVSAAGIPAGKRPPRSQNDTFTPLVANGGITGYRAVVTTTGDLLIVGGASNATTVYLAGLSGYFVDA